MEVEAVAAVRLGLQRRRGEHGELLEAFGLRRPVYRRLDQAATKIFHQLERRQPVQEGVGALADVARQRLGARGIDGLVVGQGLLDGAPIRLAHGVEVHQALQRLNTAILVHAVSALQLLAKVLLQQAAACDDGVVELVS